MIRHLIKPLWKRKGRNLLLSLELALSFVVVFAVVAIGLRYWQIYQQPVGFEWQNVWSAELLLPEGDGEGLGFDTAIYGQLQRAVEQLPEVEKVAFSAYTPYENSEWNTNYYLPGNGKLDVHLLQVSDDFFAVTDMKLLEGRWFSSIDEGAAQAPIIVNRRFAQEAFPGRSAVGQVVSDGEPGKKDSRQLRIVGVIEEFRNQGEFMAPTSFVLTRYSPASGQAHMRTMLLKVRPGTPRMFEAALLRQLKLVRNDWSFKIAPLADMRQSQLSQSTTPLMVLAVVAAFLLLMVAFGLFGVLWQNTTRRVPELGLRRATGATAGDISRQIVLEQVLLCLLPITAALILLVQLPITGVLGERLSWPLFASATLLSTLVMVLVSVGCALYPAWRASRLSPTEALHYE